MYVFRCPAVALAIVALATPALFTACSDEAEPPPRFLVEAREAGGDECPNGGTVIEAGVDANGDGNLQASEIEPAETQRVCAPEDGEPGDPGEDGLNALVRASAEPAGDNCAQSGVRIDVGLDADRDGQLDDAEVEQTEYVCSAPDGRDGASFLIRTSAALPGQCEQGGVVIESGLDADRDGALENDEVQFTRIVCAGEDGLDRRVALAVEPPGVNCPVGGQRITEGLDANGDGVLQPTEIEAVTFLCTPVASLVRTATVGPGADCAHGGLRIERGLDGDGDGALDGSEVVDTTLVCQGGEGRPQLVRTSTESAGGNCAHGGTRIETGVDVDGDGVLDPGEVLDVSFACSEDPGLDGRAGSAVRISVEPPGPNCASGGTRIETGPDDDADGQLSTEEVTNVAYACDAAASVENLVVLTAEPPGTNCLDGGQRVDSGLDDDGDGSLQPDEIDVTRFVCSAIPVLPIAIRTSALGPFTASAALENVTVEGVGGLGGNYAWTLSNAPPGIGIDPTGTPTTRLTGTPTSTGTFTLEIQLSDAIGSIARKSFTVDIDPPPCAPGRDGAVSEAFTAITVPSPAFSTAVRDLAADGSPTGWVYFTEPGSGFGRFRKRGGAKEDDLHARIAGLSAGDIGYAIHIDGPNIYLSNDATTNCTHLCIFRVSDDGGATLGLQDVGDFSSAGAPNDDIRGIHVSGSTMYAITHDSATTELYSIDLSGRLPALAVLEATYPDFEYCAGLDGDGTYLYTSCGDADSAGADGLVRIDLATGTGELVRLFPSFFPMGTTNMASVHGQDLDGDDLFDILYASADNGDDIFICQPGSMTGTNFTGEWLTGFGGDDEGMAFDRAHRAVYKLAEGSVRAARFE